VFLSRFLCLNYGDEHWLITRGIVFCEMYFEVVHVIAKLFLLLGCLSF
jgi:hypothetical protein